MNVYYRFRNTRRNDRIIEDNLEDMYFYYGIEKKIERDRELLNKNALLIRYDCEGNKLTISKHKEALKN